MYPILLILSSMLLLMTFSIYTINKNLLDHLTRIMRHYVFNMFVAFILLTLNQGVNIKETLSEAACEFIGTNIFPLLKFNE